jgi:glycopeptide antibiotics resistance protein
VRWLAFFYLIAIVFLHVFPTNSVVSADRTWNGFELDYVVHVLLFFPWMGLAWISMKSKIRMGRGSVGIWVWLLAGLLVAAGAELLQYFLAYRVFNPVDLGLNVFGVLLGCVVFYFWKGPPV